MSAVEELDKQLQALAARKPPGVSGGKVNTITKLCIDHVQSESALIQKIYTHFKKTQATHKLGVLYVVDSVTRKWIEEARHAGQDLSSSSSVGDGTYAAGVRRITELMPSLMNELFQVAPADQKERIAKLIDIWERSKTFPQNQLSEFKQKLNTGTPSKAELREIARLASKPTISDSSSHFVDTRSYTPNGSPPRNVTGPAATNGQQAQSHNVPEPQAKPQGPQDANSILAALANMGQQSNSQQQPTPPSSNPYIPAAQQPMPQMPPAGQSVPAANPLASLSSFLNAGTTSQMPTYPAQNQPALPLAPQTGQNPMDIAQVLPVLLQFGYSQEQILQALAAMQSGAPAQPMATAPQAQPPYSTAATISSTPREWEQHPSRDRDYRSRSRSPDYSRGRGARRDSPVYGDYDPSASRGDSQDDRRGGRDRARGAKDRFRQRSPLQGNAVPKNTQALKWVEYDDSLPEGNIRVLSRTLFVGGASGTDAELRNIFSQFGQVQTCIVNLDKRHAFVKMTTRKDAVNAKAAMETVKDPDVVSKARQTRWGVGFGPRDCSDYATGISVIPINRLTDADRKWLTTADFGGSGGRPIESGMVVEEPDIEIGAGVSSKAISRRVGPDHGGGRRPQQGDRGGFGRGGGNNGGGGGRFRQPEARRESPRPQETNVGVSPAVPGFGFQFPGIPMNFGNLQS
ncbi:MAG: hypothetical protein M1820_008630 [Bogoriella megaspora]|nr:MAG: hypothetical protein M1820_008630 [Bogoriella megaspora]